MPPPYLPIFLGTIGLPVFCYGQGGLHIVLGPSGGYLWGFVLGGYLLGKIVEKRSTYFYTVLGMFLCMDANYSLGTIQLAIITGLDFYQGLLLGVIPFLPLDVVKIFAAAGLSISIRQRLQKTGLILQTEKEKRFCRAAYRQLNSPQKRARQLILSSARKGLQDTHDLGFRRHHNFSF